MDSLTRVAEQVRGCVRCRLSGSRTQAVPGEGPAHVSLVLVGEGPGATEDATGRPFQGAAGRYLDAALAELGASRASVFVTSAVKCRPPGNRTPRSDEIGACASYLDRQMALLDPRVVLAMGGTAAARLHPDLPPGPVRVADLRGSAVPLGPERLLMVTYHPAAARRFPARRAPFHDDLAAVCRLAGLVS